MLSDEDHNLMMSSASDISEAVVLANWGINWTETVPGCGREARTNDINRLTFDSSQALDCSVLWSVYVFSKFWFQKTLDSLWASGLRETTPTRNAERWRPGRCASLNKWNEGFSG